MNEAVEMPAWRYKAIGGLAGAFTGLTIYMVAKYVVPEAFKVESTASMLQWGSIGLGAAIGIAKGEKITNTIMEKIS